MHSHARTSSCAHAHTRLYTTHTHTGTHVYTYTHTHTHTHTHTRAHTKRADKEARPTSVCLCRVADQLEPRTGSVKHSANGSGGLLYQDPRFIGGVSGVVIIVVVVVVVVFAVMLRRQRQRQLLPQKPMKRVIIMKPVSAVDRRVVSV